MKEGNLHRGSRPPASPPGLYWRLLTTNLWRLERKEVGGLGASAVTATHP